jgi:hypothetical protein
MINLEFTRDNIPKAFWDSLGKYVYGYKDAEGNWEYIGKGTGRRIKSHVKSKELDLDNAWIIARNLEDFEGKTDSHSFSIESLLIEIYNPALNSVSGHYKENFVMASLKGLFGDYVSGELNYHYEMVDCLERHRDKLENLVSYTQSNNNGYTIRSGTRNGHSVHMDFSDGEYVISVTVASPRGSTIEQDRARAKTLHENIVKGLGDDYPYEVIDQGGSANKAGVTSFGVEDEESMVSYFLELLS